VAAKGPVSLLDGAVALLRKPFGIEELVSEIRKHLAGAPKPEPRSQPEMRRPQGWLRFVSSGATGAGAGEPLLSGECCTLPSGSDELHPLAVR